MSIEVFVCLMVLVGSEISVLKHYTYMKLIACIAHLSLCAGQPPMGALLSKRNSINYAIEANTLQLIKREINIFCAEETNNLAT